MSSQGSTQPMRGATAEKDSAIRGESSDEKVSAPIALKDVNLQIPHGKSATGNSRVGLR